MHLKSKLCCRRFHIEKDTHRFGFVPIRRKKVEDTVQWLESKSLKNVIVSLWMSGGSSVFVKSDFSQMCVCAR